jgi:exopolyphosphatase / guanosine-5'-triphosphate,3'-diphosphate pyrophosphatase
VRVSKGRSAVISIGTNSTRALLADLSQARPRVWLMRSVGTRVGEGLRESGSISERARQRTLSVVSGYVHTLAGRYDRLSVIGTSALRRADNAAEFATAVEEVAGAPLRVLDGDEEAAASFIGAAAAVSAPAGERIGVLDVGGGSTEYAIGRGSLAERVVSCEVGAVRLTETFSELGGESGPVTSAAVADARSAVTKGLQPLAGFPSVDRLVLVGGSATTAVSVIRGHRRRFVTAPIARDELRAAFNRLCKLSLRRRKLQPGMNPQRADILPAGMLIVDVAFEVLGRDRAIASTWDLLLGYLLQTRILSA